MSEMFHTFAPWVNFILLIALLTWKLKAPIRQFVGERHAFIRDEVSRVEGLLKDSKTRYEEFAAKLKAIDAEVQALRAQSVQDGEQMKVRISTDAKRLAGTIIADSQANAKEVFADARNELRLSLGLKIIVRAEDILRSRLTGDDRARIRQEFSRKVENIQ